jgi:hypothetical protein
MGQVMEQHIIIFFGFLENMFRCEHISCDSIDRHQKSPLVLASFLPEECRIENEYRGDISREIRMYANIIVFFGKRYLSLNTEVSFLWIVFTEREESFASSERVCLWKE